MLISFGILWMGAPKAFKPKSKKMSSLIVYGWLTILFIKYFGNTSAEHALNHQGCSSVPWSIFLGHLGNSVWLVTPLQGCSLSCSWKWAKWRVFKKRNGWRTELWVFPQLVTALKHLIQYLDQIPKHNEADELCSFWNPWHCRWLHNCL